MQKSVLAIAAALAVLSAGSLLSNRAQAGASISAPTKYGNTSQPVARAGVAWSNRHRGFGISEFSSSSANNSPRKR